MRRHFVFLILLFPITSWAGGGWPQPKRAGYFKFSQNLIYATHFYGPSGELVDITTIQLFTTSLYGEYGINNRMTGIVYFPFFVRNTLNAIQYNQSGRKEPGDSFNSIGDAEIGIKYAVIKDKPVVVSGSFYLGLPLGATAGGSSQILQTGDGEFNQMIRIDISHSFYPKPIYVSAYGAFNNRTKGFSDEVRLGGEVGMTLKNFIPIVKLAVVQSLFNGDASAAQNGVFSNNTEYISPTFELNYQLNQSIGLSASGGFAFAGRNILAAPNWSMGLYLKW